MSRYRVEPDRRLRWLHVMLPLAFSLSVVLSWKLWVSSRLFPLSPVSAALPPLPFPLDYLGLLLLLGCLVASAIAAQPRTLLLTGCALAVGLSLWDQMRWQPWVYQYLCMLTALGLYAGKTPADTQQRAALTICRLIVVATYFWSGVHKLNATFVRETWPDLASAVLRLLPPAVQQLPPVVWLSIPLLEMGVGLGLLARPSRQAAVLLGLVTHLVVLTCLLASGKNRVVWPWNLAMAGCVVALFWHDRDTTPRTLLRPQNAFHTLILLLFGVLPALSLLDRWDAYLSSALYSGDIHQAVIYGSPAIMARLPAPIQPYIWQGTTPFFVDLNRWAYGELHVPLYPEPRVYRSIMAQICASVGNATELKLRITTRPHLLTGHRASEYYDCQHLYGDGL